MRAILAAFGLACIVSSAASAQLATLDGGSAPRPLDGVAAVGTPSAAVPRDDAAASDCEARTRAFRARNTQSPSRRQHALAECLAAEERRQGVEIADD